MPACSVLLLLLSLAAVLSGILIYQAYDPGQVSVYLDNSVPYVGTGVPRMDGIDGSGVRVAVIDTGVDFEHPDLLGWGSDGKVIGGYNFIDRNEPPMDTNGHGTQVAGVIAADGRMVGVAPKAKILAYKVSEDGESVSSDLIVSAVEMAVRDGADVINISLGINKTNPKIDRAVRHALDEGILVVTAAGNDGPGPGTIGSPGRNAGAITVGATYNNLTSSLVATLEVDGSPYTVIPMVGSTAIDDPLEGRMVFGGYGRASDLAGVDVAGSVLLVERGSDTEGELLYFSIKEGNAADAGAAALIVYNNEPGLFLGELAAEFAAPGYEPRIPTVSIDRSEGLEIREMIGGDPDAVLRLFYNPDSVAHFSSKGPVSPFYIKPEILAPGAYINTTQNGAGYNLTSGTSYAAPHVSGAAALLLQKNPALRHDEVRSLLLTTAEPVHDIGGKRLPIVDAGSGRVNIERAYNADLIITPPNFVVSVSSANPAVHERMSLKSVGSALDGLQVRFEGPDAAVFEHSLEADALRVKIGMTGDGFGDYDGVIVITHRGTQYVVPVLIHFTPGSVSAAEKDGWLHFDVIHSEPWSFAKISVTNSEDGTADTVTTIPGREASMRIFENAEYWIDAKIRTDQGSTDAFSTVSVTTIQDGLDGTALMDVPERQIWIIGGTVAAIGAAGMVLKRQCVRA